MYSRRILLSSIVLAVTVMALVGGSSLAEETVVNPEIYGSWDLLKLEQSGMAIHLSLIIREGQVIASSTCSFKDYKVLAETSSPAVITADEIRTLESNKVTKEYSPGFLQCSATVQAGIMQYRLSGDKLVLTIPEKGETVELSRSGKSQSRAVAHQKKSSKPKLARAYANRGAAYSKKGQYNEAIREYNQALAINPKYTVAYYNRSVAYTRIKQYDRAVTDCNKALQLDPKHANSYYTRGVSYWHLGSKDQAIKDFQAAARLGHQGAQDFLKSIGIE